METKRGFKNGLLVSGFLVFLLLAGILFVGLQAYEGHCLSFEPPERPCSLLEFLYPYLLLLILYSIMGRPIISICIFVIILAPPLIGRLLGKRSSKPEIVD
jgi:hypothetical protein